MSLRLVTRSVWANPGNTGKRLRKSVEAIGWQLHKRIIRRPKPIRLANGARFMAYPDCVISSALCYADWPEYNELQFCRAHLAPEDTVIDVGANVGHFSILLADIVGPANLICFEPTPIAWRRLSENFELNGWPTTNLYPSAVGAEPGTVAYSDSETPATTNSIGPEARSGKMFQARMVTLDDRFDEWKEKRIGLLKVDVEGYELQVFRGAVRLIQNLRPRLIMFESLDGAPHSDIRALLEKVSYILFQIGDDGRPVRESLDAQNLFAVPRELAHEYRVRTES